MILNVMEHHVLDAYQRLKGSIDDFVDSPEHQEDVVVYALNRLSAKYVVTEEGKAVTEAMLDSPQHRTEIDIRVLEALKLVARVPRSSHRPRARVGSG